MSDLRPWAAGTLLLALVASACRLATQPPTPRLNNGGVPDAAGLTSPEWTVGLTVPVTVYEIRSFDGQPAWCLDTRLMLQRLRDGINAGSGSCQASTLPLADGVASLSYVCAMRDLGNGCRDSYSVTLWPEQRDDSTTAYSVKAFGWIRRSCPPSVVIENVAVAPPDLFPRLQQLVGGNSKRVTEFFAPCVKH